ncbi:hypothetical protein AVEN_47959-1 [Araneus ventricosus]|uniref:Endonuclease/exonuclease/phosphatase domain-containing protein n=1 Tax=Araneus ventricosus TaxID=182803 RepID=A0A4Y2DSI3_ARAVE|nr:hypothetical protein AVEN_47959-1 [Araneus ventricosus]
MPNFSPGDAKSLNEINSDHNPVSFEIDINANIPAITKVLKTTNWIKFTDHMQNLIPGNPTINTISDIEDSISKFTSSILTAINQASKSKLIKGAHRKFPPNITKKITLRNQLNKRLQITFDPRFKRNANRLTNEIKRNIEIHNQDSWKD